MGIETSAASTRKLAGRHAFVLGLITLHVFLVAATGQYYAKLRVPVGAAELYPTELVLFASILFGVRALTAVPRDRITNLVFAFLATGGIWLAIDGVGDFQGAGTKAVSFFVYSLFYFFIRGAARTSRDRGRILQAFAVAAFVGVALGALEMEFGEGFPTSTGSLRWLPGEFALYSLFAAMVVAVPAILTRRLSRRSAFILGAAIAELILAQHRSGFVAFAVALGATAVFLGGSTQALRGTMKLVALAVLAIALFTLFFGGGYVDDTVTRISQTTDLSDGTVAWRLLSWYEVGSGVLEQPWGHGFAQWNFSFTLSDPLLGSHNGFLDLAYRIGIPGLLVFLAIPFTLLSGARRLVQRKGASQHVQLVIACACMLSFLVFASFNMAMEAPYMSILFWVALGVGAEALADRAGS